VAADADHVPPGRHGRPAGLLKAATLRGNHELGDEMTRCRDGDLECRCRDEVTVARKRPIQEDAIPTRHLTTGLQLLKQRIAKPGTVKADHGADRGLPGVTVTRGSPEVRTGGLDDWVSHPVDGDPNAGVADGPDDGSNDGEGAICVQPASTTPMMRTRSVWAIRTIVRRRGAQIEEVRLGRVVGRPSLRAVGLSVRGSLAVVYLGSDQPAVERRPMTDCHDVVWPGRETGECLRNARGTGARLASIP
jgi:hypothetical protein